VKAQALGAGMFVPRGGPRFTLPSEGISNFLRRGYGGQSELVGGWVGSLLHAAGNIRGYSKPPKWGGRGEFAVRTPPGRPLPQSQRGDEGEQSLTLQRPQARPARSYPEAAKAQTGGHLKSSPDGKSSWGARRTGQTSALR